MSDHSIPAMTDPLGKHWNQPPRDLILVDETHALMDRRTLERLSVYSSTTPTGVYPGKMWRASRHLGWLLCWYGDDEGGRCAMHARAILIVEASGA